MSGFLVLFSSRPALVYYLLCEYKMSSQVGESAGWTTVCTVRSRQRAKAKHWLNSNLIAVAPLLLGQSQAPLLSGARRGSIRGFFLVFLPLCNFSDLGWPPRFFLSWARQAQVFMRRGERGIACGPGWVAARTCGRILRWARFLSRGTYMPEAAVVELVWPLLCCATASSAFWGCVPALVDWREWNGVPFRS